jgi:hypothetical protein
MVGEGGDGSGRRRRSGFSTAAPIRNRGKKAQGAQRAGYGRSVRASERRSVRAPAEPEAEDEGADWKRVAAQAVCEVERGDPLRLEGVKSQALTSRPPAFAECA